MSSFPAAFTFVEGDVTSPGSADFEIQMTGSLNLQASDFVFSSNPCYCRGTLIETVRGENRMSKTCRLATKS